jgi:hypothetical protein
VRPDVLAERAARPATAPTSFANTIDVHWPRDVLYLLLSKIVEGERQSIADVLVDGVRDKDGSGFGERLHEEATISTVAPMMGVFKRQRPSRSSLSAPFRHRLRS